MAVAAEHDTLSRARSLDVGPQSGALHIAHFADVMYFHRHIFRTTRLAYPCPEPINKISSTIEVDMRLCLVINMPRCRSRFDNCEAEHLHKDPLVTAFIPQAEAIPV